MHLIEKYHTLLHHMYRKQMYLRWYCQCYLWIDAPKHTYVRIQVVTEINFHMTNVSFAIPYFPSGMVIRPLKPYPTLSWGQLVARVCVLVSTVQLHWFHHLDANVLLTLMQWLINWLWLGEQLYVTIRYLGRSDNDSVMNVEMGCNVSIAHTCIWHFYRL